MTLAQVGGEGGGPKIPAHCGANEVMSGFWGLWSPGDGVVQLNGTCKSLSTSNTALLLGSGGFSGSSFQDDCAGGEIAVGASGSADLGLRSIGAICAAQTTVQNGGSASTPHVPAGSSSGIAWQRRCPPFHALKGFRLRSGDTVDRLELVCQDVRDGRNIDQSLLQRAGLTGEYRYIETCQSRAVMTGMMTSTNSEVTPEIAVRRLGGWCANVWDAPFPMPFEPINDGRHVLPTHGGTSLNQPPNWIEAVDRCPAGQALIGLTAHSSLGIFAGIQGKCAEVEAWSNGAAGPTSDLPFRGRTTIPVPRMCPSRNFMVGWSIDTDTTVHGVRPICRKFSNTGGVAIASEIFDGALSTLSSILM
jgi:hypothetical protein